MQSRLTLRDEHYQIACDIRESTGLGSLTEVIGALLTRYGRHLRETWEVKPDYVYEPKPFVAETTQNAPMQAVTMPTDEGQNLSPLEF